MTLKEEPAPLHLTRDEFQKIYDQGADAVYTLFEGLLFHVNVLAARIKQLEGQINTNSRNSGKPPSSDGLARPQSLRKKSGKKSGAQKGHRGHTLEMVDHPDRVETLRVERCRCCGISLADQGARAVERRHVFDTPPQKLIVTEYRAERKTRPTCGALNRASFPEGISQPAQYGPEIRSLAVYLNPQGLDWLLPPGRHPEHPATPRRVDSQASPDVPPQAVEETKNQAAQPGRARHSLRMGGLHQRLPQGILAFGEHSPGKQSPRLCLLAKPRAVQLA